MKSKVIIDFTEWRDADLDHDAQVICGRMDGNPRFPMLADQVAAVVSATGNYHTAFIAAAGGGKEAHSRKDACRKVLVKALRVLGFNINQVADGDKELLDTTGYPLARTATVRRKAKDEIGLAEGHRSVTVTLKGHPEADNYLLQYTAAPVGDGSVWTTVCMTTTTAVIDGLETEQRYAFRVAPVLHLTAPEYSDPVVSWYVR